MAGFGTPHHALTGVTTLPITAWIGPRNEPGHTTRRHRAHILTDDGRMWRLEPT